MKRLALNVSVAATLAVVILQAQNPLSGDVKAAYQPVKINILKAAEKMPEPEYGFKPTPDVRTFGQLIAHAPHNTALTKKIAEGVDALCAPKLLDSQLPPCSPRFGGTLA